MQQKFRQKPVEAIQWLGEQSFDKLFQFADAENNLGIVGMKGGKGDIAVIGTPKGSVEVGVNDWIIKNADGSLSPFSFDQDTFQKTYEPIEESNLNKEDAPQIYTLGKQRVRMNFNLSNENIVDIIKKKSAEIIDLMQDIKNDEVSFTYEESIEQKQNKSSERIRLISLAQTAYEEACMWAVKAATY